MGTACPSPETQEEIRHTFLYDANGMRIKRTEPDGKTYNYVYNGGSLSQMTVGSNTLYFTYDANGTPLTVTYNGTTYYYATNLQGDVTAILNSAGAAVVTYTYDAWGNILDTAGTMKDTLGFHNPLRYRGYVYDEETGLYYLQSRYYNPEWGRFISADGQISDVGGELLGNNMFAYSFNNPLNMSDHDGNWPKWAKKLAAAVAVVVVVAVAAAVTVATAGSGTAIACFAVGAAKGAAVGFVTGAVTGAAEGAIEHRITTGSWDGAGEAALNRMADNALSGSISGAITGGITSNSCFVAGTAILSSAGFVPIESICTGDKVWAENPETGERSLKAVVQTFVNETYELIHISVNGESIVTTPEHPFYAPVKGWTAACKLRAGDILVTVNGEYVVVEKIQHEILESPITVYNFEVADFHTYYVGNTNVLVHNLCSNPGGRHGGTAHRAKISEVKESLVSDGWQVSSSEMRVSVGGGKYRYPDITAIKDGATRYYQIGRQTKAGTPVAREARALKDLVSTRKQVFFIPYN